MVVWVWSFVSLSSWALSSPKPPNSPKFHMNMLGLVGWQVWKACKSFGIRVKGAQSRPPLFILFYFQNFQAQGSERNRFNTNLNFPHGKISFFWNFHIYFLFLIFILDLQSMWANFLSNLDVKRSSIHELWTPIYYSYGVRLR